ncbi:MAG: NAD-dependent epimerase/dehydratase family protein [Fusobacteriaceae bacterium]
MKKTLMITGASGFIGSNFIERYQEEYSIIPIDLIKERPEDLNYKGVDCILHLAALVHQMKGAPREKYFEVNTELTRRIAESAKKSGVKHFVFYSTVAVYGTHGYFDHEKILSVNSPTNPKTPYAESKLEAEKILLNMKDNNFKVAILRPPMVYGDNCPGNMKKLEKLVDIFPILPFGNDENKRSMVQVQRLLNITDKIIKNRIEIVSIPQDEKNASIKEIVENIANKKNKKIKLVRIPIFILKIFHKIKPSIFESLYGSLSFEVDFF